MGAEGVRAAQTRLERIVNAAIREVLGSVPSNAVLSEDRTGLMNRIRDLARREALALGVDVIDVRLTRTDLPEQNLAATYARMRAEREREATDEIARGNEAASRVRASADRTVVELTSDARRQAEVVRGEADAKRNAIYAEAFGRDPEFFAFTRSLTAYERSMKGTNSSIVMQPELGVLRVPARLRRARIGHRDGGAGGRPAGRHRSRWRGRAAGTRAGRSRNCAGRRIELG